MLAPRQNIEVHHRHVGRRHNPVIVRNREQEHVDKRRQMANRVVVRAERRKHLAVEQVAVGIRCIHNDIATLKEAPDAGDEQLALESLDF